MTKTMTKSELIERLAERNPRLVARDADEAVKTILDAMSAALADGSRIEIRGFGSFALSSAPRLVLPAALAAFSVLSCFMASVSSAASFAFTARLIERFLRSTLMIIAVTLSPSFRTVRRSSTRSRENSEARR